MKWGSGVAGAWCKPSIGTRSSLFTRVCVNIEWNDHWKCKNQKEELERSIKLIMIRDVCFDICVRMRCFNFIECCKYASVWLYMYLYIVIFVCINKVNRTVFTPLICRFIEITTLYCVQSSRDAVTYRDFLNNNCDHDRRVWCVWVRVCLCVRVWIANRSETISRSRRREIDETRGGGGPTTRNE